MKRCQVKRISERDMKTQKGHEYTMDERKRIGSKFDVGRPSFVSGIG